jgi:diaminohydroxyphosphoribosylaminopyrimidine deaminase/5-amino-6-(5-phosphoribosylamino)uracil reductase
LRMPTVSPGVDLMHMDRALDLARGGWGRVAPNPLVGAVVVRDGSVVGEGYHAAYGAEHAEVVALRKAGERARGADMYVTLEPCAHHGQTPPCAPAIVAAGVRRVVIANRDPNPLASGGVGILEAAGVEVVVGVRSGPAARLNASFLWNSQGSGPWVALKLALSRDMKIAARRGERTAITGPEAAEWVHRCRAGHDAIMVGGRTATIDDPFLTVRGAPIRQPPRRVVVDPTLELPEDSHLVTTTDQAPLVVLCGADAPVARRKALESRGASLEVVEARPDGELSLPHVLSALRRMGVTSVFVEGGGRLATALLIEGLVQRQYLLLAPFALGPEGVSAYDDELASRFGEWKVAGRTLLGRDVLIELDSKEALHALREAA